MPYSVLEQFMVRPDALKKQKGGKNMKDKPEKTFSEQLADTGRKILENEQKELDKKKQKFLKLIEGKENWKIRISLSVPDILVLSRVLCRSLSLDDILQKQSYAIFSCMEEKTLVSDVLHKLLLSFRRSSSHREDMITHPDYNDKKWHGNALDIIFNTRNAFNVSYTFVDAQRLNQDFICESIGEDQYRKNARKVLKKIIEREVK